MLTLLFIFQVYSGNDYENSTTLAPGTCDLLSALSPRSSSVSGPASASLPNSEAILKEWGRDLRLACTYIDQVRVDERIHGSPGASV